MRNYLTAYVGFPGDETKFARFWPADAHVIGKRDITPFFSLCLYWPAMLLSGQPAACQSGSLSAGFYHALEGRRISKTQQYR